MVVWAAFEMVWFDGRVLIMEVVGTQEKGRPARQWKDVVEYDMWVMGWEKGMAMDRETWRWGI